MIIHSANETAVNDISYSRTDIIVDFSEKAHAATWPEKESLDPSSAVPAYQPDERLRWNGQEPF